MATMRQKMAVEALVANGGNVTAAMRKAGYTEATANTPQKLTESKGFEELCQEAGLTDDFILKALHDDIKQKPRRRSTELSLAADIRGLKKQKIELGGEGLLALEQTLRLAITKKDE